MPSIAAPFAHEQVGGGTGQTVEDGVVRRADRTSKVGLRGPPAAEFRQAAGGLQSSHASSRCKPSGRGQIDDVGLLEAVSIAFLDVLDFPGSDSPPDGRFGDPEIIANLLQ